MQETALSFENNKNHFKGEVIDPHHAINTYNSMQSNDSCVFGTFGFGQQKFNEAIHSFMRCFRIQSKSESNC